LRQVLARCEELIHPYSADDFDGIEVDDLAYALDFLAHSPGKVGELFEPANPIVNPDAPTAKDLDLAERAGQPIKLKRKGKAINDDHFVIVTNAAATDTMISANDLRLLIILKALAGQKGICWWSEEKLAELMPGMTGDDTVGKKGVSLRKIQNSIANLAHRKYIQVVGADDRETYKRLGWNHHTPGNTYIVDAARFV
jgi:hypothetical protein